MSIYAIGDAQGCLDQVQRLLEQLSSAGPDPRYIFVGDLINRGPRSLDTLRFVRSLGERAKVLLGNHDLHLLAVANGVRLPGKSDTIAEILQAPDREELLTWLRQQPLALFENGHLLVHAGVLPQWDVAQTLALAQEVSDALRGPAWQEFLHHMYGNSPARWDNALHGVDRLRCIVNALTRIRYCRADGSMDFSSSENIAAAPADCLPWFELSERRTAGTPVVFGHWSTLGLLMRDNLVGLDTGCVWGGKLTAVRLQDRTVFQVGCPQHQQPGIKK
ncbi:MAG: symmetrical bis(5'-nucleosyl)-tetraphosphatase [Burkholderiaceae bacterium]|nr:symmetrical bis(5'-nucleosyl)-tetraphosphatase [Burkholderiaceae bacterium]